jgi:hypothetical protein
VRIWWRSLWILWERSALSGDEMRSSWVIELELDDIEVMCAIMSRLIRRLTDIVRS